MEYFSLQVEFSTLGSLAARRSSGIKKKFYDFAKSIIEIQMVTPAGRDVKVA